MQYPTILHLVSAVFKERGVVCVLIGGFAVNFHNVARATGDVDFLTTRKNFDAVWDLLETEGLSKFSEQKTFVQLKDNKGCLKDLDFMFVDKEVLEKIVEDGKRIEIAGMEFIVPSLDHLIALKLHSVKFDTRREHKDIVDIVGLVRSNNVDVKTEKFKELCLKYGTNSLYKRILSHLR